MGQSRRAKHFLLRAGAAGRNFHFLRGRLRGPNQQSCTVPGCVEVWTGDARSAGCSCVRGRDKWNGQSPCLNVSDEGTKMGPLAADPPVLPGPWLRSPSKQQRLACQARAAWLGCAKGRRSWSSCSLSVSKREQERCCCLEAPQHGFGKGQPPLVRSPPPAGALSALESGVWTRATRPFPFRSAPHVAAAGRS